jgi:citrate synthase
MLLWSGDLDAPWGPSLELLRWKTLWRPLIQQTRTLTPLQACSIWLATLAAHDEAASDLRNSAVRQAGMRIIRLLTGAATRATPPGSPVADALQNHWCPRDKGSRALLDAALILCADHELNISAFTARCIASAAAGPYAVVAGGLAALGGLRHGGECERGEALFDEAARTRARHQLLAQKLRRGERIPGFGQPLYPEGDPRARWLLDAVARHAPRSAAMRLSRELQQQAQELMDEYPTIDFALVTLSRALGLPSGAPLALFALGRTAGWLAHALEQYQDPRMIRPRARYVGRPPSA